MSRPQFEQDFAGDALDSLYDEFGWTNCTYTAPDASEVSDLTLRRQKPLAHQTSMDQRQSNVQTTQIMVRVSELAARPQKNGRFLLDDGAAGEVWTIFEDVGPAHNGQWICQCKRVGTERVMSKSRE